VNETRGDASSDEAPPALHDRGRRWAWPVLIGLLALVGVLFAAADIGLRTPLLGPFGSVIASPRAQATPTTGVDRFNRSRIAERLTLSMPFGPVQFLSPIRAVEGFLSNGAGLFLLALGALLLFPGRSRVAVQRLESRAGVAIALAAGVATALLTVAAVSLLRFTLIFLPAIPIVLAVALAASLFGIACVALAIGRLVERRLSLPDAHPLVVALVGSLIVFDLAVIPYLGLAALVVIAITGLGVAVVTRFGSETGWSFSDLRW